MPDHIDMCVLKVTPVTAFQNQRQQPFATIFFLGWDNLDRMLGLVNIIVWTPEGMHVMLLKIQGAYLAVARVQERRAGADHDSTRGASRGQKSG